MNPPYKANMALTGTLKKSRHRREVLTAAVLSTPRLGGGGWPAQGCMFAACDSRHMYFGLVYCICSAAVSQWLTVVVHLFCLAVLHA